MTPIQKARLSGFNASLAKRGVSVFLQITPPYEFTAIVEKFMPDTDAHMPSKETRHSSRIHLRKTDLREFEVETEKQIEVGDVFEHFDDLAGKWFTHRITNDETNPIDITAVFRCESTEKAQ